MRHFACIALFLSVAVANLQTVQPCQAQRPPWEVLTPTEQEEGTFLSVTRSAHDRPILLVRYPWTVHRHASIEIRQLLADDVEDSRILPLRFVSNALWEETKVKVHRARERATDIRKTYRVTGVFPDKKLEFSLISERNSLGRPSSMLAEKFTPLLRPDENDSRRVAWGVFPFLEDWSSDKRTLYLDLPPEQFGQPMKLRVWFLRYGKTIWSETIDWPGMNIAEVLEQESDDAGR